MPFPQIEEMLTQFKALGAKALEISGGGNPLLYRDKENNKNIFLEKPGFKRISDFYKIKKIKMNV